MKTKKQNRNIIIVKQSQPIYPNAADRNYRATRALNVVTALVSGMGFVSAMVFLVTTV